MSIAAGELNRYILVESRSTTTDALNQPIDSWEPFLTLWANVKGSTGMGAIRNNNEGLARALNSYSFRIRYRADINTGMRVNLDGTYFDIVAVRHDLDQRSWTDLVCEVGGNNG